jgi:hypothetical protein
MHQVQQTYNAQLRSVTKCNHYRNRLLVWTVESHKANFRLHQFTFERFHVLLNSLFKVLFNFPSRYLFAIRLVLVFSLGWSLPPALGCIPKQPDSKVVSDVRQFSRKSTGLSPSMGVLWAAIKRTWGDCANAENNLNTTVPNSMTLQDSVLGFSLFARRY